MKSYRPRKFIPQRFLSLLLRQLRNLVLCPDDTTSPTLYTTFKRSILQHKITTPESVQSELPGGQDAQAPSGSTVSFSEIAKLPFEPVCLAFARVPTTSPGQQCTLLAAGGQSAELHLSLHSPNFEHRLWEYHLHIKKASINNSVLVLPPSPQPRGFASKTTSKPLTMRVLVSNNDRAVKFYEVDIGRLGADVPGIGLAIGKRGESRERSSSVSHSPRSTRRRDSESIAHASPYSSHDVHHDVFSPNPADVGELVRRYAEIKLDSAVNFSKRLPFKSTFKLSDESSSFRHQRHVDPPFHHRLTNYLFT